MEALFYNFWWLLFPAAFFVAGGFNAWVASSRRRGAMDLLKTYADNGREPPAELVRAAYGSAHNGDA